jgi:hypothetical protein
MVTFPTIPTTYIITTQVPYIIPTHVPYIMGIVGNVTTLTLNASMELTYSVTVAMSMVTRLKCVRYTRYMAMVIKYKILYKGKSIQSECGYVPHNTHNIHHYYPSPMHHPYSCPIHHPYSCPIHHSLEQIRDLPLGKTVDNITNKTIQTIWNIIILETGIWVGMMYGT